MGIRVKFRPQVSISVAHSLKTDQYVYDMSKSQIYAAIKFSKLRIVFQHFLGSFYVRPY